MAESRWKSSARPLHVRRWGDEAVIYDDYAGATHYLIPLATAIWSHVQAQGSASIAELSRHLSQLPDIMVATAGPARIEEVLGELRRLELIESEPN